MAKLTDTEELFKLLSNYEYSKDSELKHTARSIHFKNEKDGIDAKIDIEFGEVKLNINGKSKLKKEYYGIEQGLADTIMDKIVAAKQ